MWRLLDSQVDLPRRGSTEAWVFRGALGIGGVPRWTPRWAPSEEGESTDLIPFSL